MYKIILTFSCLLFFSCFTSKNVIFEIQNLSDFQLENLLISTSSGESNSYLLVQKSCKLSSTLNLDNVPKTDGDFYIEYYINGEMKTKKFGYYSNGSPLANNYYIVISNDDIIIKETH